MTEVDWFFLAGGALSAAVGYAIGYVNGQDAQREQDRADRLKQLRRPGR